MSLPRFALVFLFVAGCAEGTKPTPLPRVGDKSTLYARMGGEAGIKKIVDDLVTEVVASDKYRPEHKKHFQEGDVAGLKKKLFEQFGQEAGGPQKYTGKSMKEAHKGLGITEADFAALVDSLVRALDKNKVSADDQKEFLTKLARYKDDVLAPPELKGVIQKKE